MIERGHRELASAIVRDAAHRYIASRRGRVEGFVCGHFSLRGSLALHRRAIGWDLLRGPANLFLAGPALAVRLASWSAARAGNPGLGARLARLRLIFQTEVSREVAWLVATELLELPCRQQDRASNRDAIAATILADYRAVQLLGGQPGEFVAHGHETHIRLASAVESYLGSRIAIAELTTGFAAAGVGAFTVKQATPGLVTLGSAIAGAVAQQAAIAAFPLGAGLGGLWYGLFPAHAGPGLLAAATGGVFLGAALLASFSGIVTDPLQRWLGLHQRRLTRLLDTLEAILSGNESKDASPREHYIARLVDIFDLATLALRVSHA